MGLFKDLFKNEERERPEKKDFQWNLLDSEPRLQELEHESENKRVLIFKHSTRCGISRMVLRQFEATHGGSDGGVQFYFLDLLKHRSLSQAIASKFQVIHESPQIILLKNGKVIRHASHHAILNTSLED